MKSTTLPASLTLSDPRAAEFAPLMQAIVQSGYGGLEVYRHEQRERPRIAANEVLVKVVAAGLDRGTWHLMTGRPYLMRLMGFGFSKPKQPVPGLDVAGEVVEVGAAVSRFKVGDAVFGIAKGSYAEYAAALETKLAKKPAHVSFAEAAVLGVSGTTALGAVEKSGVGPGQKVLVIGASGGVGSYAVQLAKAMGAEVTGVCSAAKAELVRALGASRVLDYARDDFADGAVRYDVILDLGGNAPLSRLRRALTKTGTLVIVGGENGGDWSAGMGRMLWAAIISAFVKHRFVALMAEEHFGPLERLAALVNEGTVKPAIDRAFPLAKMPEAMRQLEAGTVQGKLVIQVA